MRRTIMGVAGVSTVAERARIGIVRDEVFLDHEAPGYHPERPERLISTWRALDAS